MKIYQITNPVDVDLPVSVAEAKVYCRTDEDDTSEDSLFENLIRGAVVDAEVFMHRWVVEQEFKIKLRTWLNAELGVLPLKYISDVPVVVAKYYDVSNTLQTLDTSNYEIVDDLQVPYIRFISGALPVLNTNRTAPIEITFTAGWPVAEVPQNIKLAILTHVAWHYDNRSATKVEFQRSFEHCLMGHKMVLIG